VRALALAGALLDVPELEAPRSGDTFREIAYEERRGVGYLRFDFYNGAMSTDQCRRLLEAYRSARERPTGVIVLMGGPDFFSNGFHLNLIEAAADPAAESWRNLLAIDELVREVIETDAQVVVSALGGDAAAGGVPFALAADRVLAREDVVLNPYYGHMGGLYGSEYWTYLLPRRVGEATAARLTSAPFRPLGAQRAVELGLLDAAFGETADRFRADVRRYAERLARDPALPTRLELKRRTRALHEARKPLAAYRTEELARSHACFFGTDRSYHEARHRFVRKL
jgi:putative two-component system hydrogenase maturation factor HypX/HoxX